MSTTADRIVAEALELPPPVRAFVAEKLIESLDAPAAVDLSPAWREEISRRCKELDEGLATLEAAETVFARAYSTLT